MFRFSQTWYLDSVPEAGLVVMLRQGRTPSARLMRLKASTRKSELSGSEISVRAQGQQC